jgi:hypothetical protein
MVSEVIAGQDDSFVVTKVCEEVDGICDPQTIYLAVNGEPSDFVPTNGSSETPFGAWDQLFANQYGNSSKTSRTLTLAQSETFEHVELTLHEGKLKAGSSKVFPRVIEDVLISQLDLNGDGRKERVSFQCDAIIGNNQEPTDCEDLQIFYGEDELYRNSDEILSSKVLASLITHPKGTVLRLVTQPTAEEFFTVHRVELFGNRDGEVARLWDDYVYGDITWKDDGSWLSTNSDCVRAARYRYHEDGSETLLKSGRERFERKRFQWNGLKVTTKTEKVWFDNKSRCQSMGRCPYVYAGNESNMLKLGEVLRDQVGVKRWNNDFITVPRKLVSADGSLHIRIAEEKPDEVSLLDDVWLHVDGRQLQPVHCETAMCRKDGVTHSLKPGEHIDLRFEDIPSNGTIRLFVNGFYRDLR